MRTKIKSGTQLAGALMILYRRAGWVSPKDACFITVNFPSGKVKYMSWKGAARLTDLYYDVLTPGAEILRRTARGRDAEWYEYKLTRAGKKKAKALLTNA